MQTSCVFYYRAELLIKYFVCKDKNSSDIKYFYIIQKHVFLVSVLQ